MTENSLAHDVGRTEEKPHDRLTALCDHMCKPLDVEPDVRSVILVDDSKGNSGAMIHGFEAGQESEAIIMVIRHAEAMLRSHGRTLKEALDVLYKTAQ